RSRHGRGRRARRAGQRRAILGARVPAPPRGRVVGLDDRARVHRPRRAGSSDPRRGRDGGRHPAPGYGGGHHPTRRDHRLVRRRHRRQDARRHRHQLECGETERVAKDGRRISIALSVSPIRDAHGVVVGASSIKREITERKLAQEELARREERYRALVTATSSIIWITDPAGNFVEPQASWEEYTGQAWEEYRDFGWAGAVHPDDRDPVLAVWSRARADGTVFETEGRLWSRAHQAYRHVVARSAPV